MSTSKLPFLKKKKSLHLMSFLKIL